MGLKRELFQKPFNFRMPSAMLKAVYNTDDRKKNNDSVNVIEGGLNELNNEDEDEITIEQLYKIWDIVKKIL